LFLPRHLGEADSAQRRDVETMERGAGETVLVVDDEAHVRMLVIETLSESAYRTLEAQDGRAALEILRTDARIDLLITDVGLPGGMNGRQLADAAREMRPGLKILFITGYAENAVVGAGHLPSGMAVLVKPFAMAALGAKIRDVLQS
jgi:CheY-like chemotaxis protein